MTPERYKIAQAKIGLIASRLGLSGPVFVTARDYYLRGFGDGVEEILTSSPKLEALETSIKLKDLRLDIIEKENKRLHLSLEHRKKLHVDAVAELKSVIDRLTLLIGIRDPALLKSMEDLRKRLEV